MTEPDRLLDEFVTAHARGERPDVRAFLDRAGPAREQLGLLIDRYLSLAPVQEPDEETAVALRARLEHVTPLTAARTRLPLKVDEVVERLRAALGLPESLRARLRTAYQQLEAEQLDPAGVDSRVWEALRGIVGLDARRLVRSAEASGQAAVYLREMQAPGAAPSLAAARDQESVNPDAVDLLFRAQV